MKAFLLGLIAVGLMVTAVLGICSEKEDSAVPEPTTELKESILREGPSLISEGNYDQVFVSIADLPSAEREDVQIKTLECFASLKCWVSESKEFCKTKFFTLRHNLILLGDTQATPLLLVFLKDTDDWMRKHAAELLGRIGDKRALTDLRDAADNDENSRVRHYAQWAYTMISEKKFSPEDREISATLETTAAIKEFLIHEGPSLISEGNYDQILDLIADLPSLERDDVQIKTLECFANLKCWANERKQTCKTDGFTLRHNLMLLRDTDTTPLLLIFLNDTDEWMRKYAAELLGYIGDKRALAALRAVADNDENHKVRSCAKSAYKEISKREHTVEEQE